MSIIRVSLSNTFTHYSLDVGTELGVKEANYVGIDGAVEHVRPQRHLDPNTELLLARLSLLKHSITSWTGSEIYCLTLGLQCLIIIMLNWTS